MFLSAFKAKAREVAEEGAGFLDLTDDDIISNSHGHVVDLTVLDIPVCNYRKDAEERERESAFDDAYAEEQNRKAFLFEIEEEERLATYAQRLQDEINFREFIFGPYLSLRGYDLSYGPANFK